MIIYLPGLLPELQQALRAYQNINRNRSALEIVLVPSVTDSARRMKYQRVLRPAVCCCISAGFRLLIEFENLRIVKGSYNLSRTEETYDTFIKSVVLTFTNHIVINVEFVQCVDAFHTQYVLPFGINQS
jgi:hypothetical protein